MSTTAKKRAYQIVQRVRVVSAELEVAQEELDEQLDVVRHSCKHENLGECCQIGKSYFSSRLCLDCGVWEHENGAGFHILTNAHPKKYNNRDELESALPFPTVIWEWCYGQGGHGLPGHPVVKGQLISTRCYSCFVAIWLIGQKGLGRCQSCNNRIDPTYNHCKVCRPRRRKARKLVLIDTEICPACRGRCMWWYSYGDGTGGGQWADCDTCKKTGVVTAAEAKRYRKSRR